MAQHGSLAVEAVRNESVTSFFMSYAANTYSLAEYDGLLRSGAPSVDATYVFSDVSSSVYATHSELSEFFGNVTRRMYADFRAASVPHAAARGTLGLLVGGPGRATTTMPTATRSSICWRGGKQWEVVHRTNGSRVVVRQRPGELGGCRASRTTSTALTAKASTPPRRRRCCPRFNLPRPTPFARRVERVASADALPTLRLALEQAHVIANPPQRNPTSRADGPLALAAKHGNARASH